MLILEMIDEDVSVTIPEMTSMTGVTTRTIGFSFTDIPKLEQCPESFSKKILKRSLNKNFVKKQ